jgi:hypothetical protein
MQLSYFFLSALYLVVCFFISFSLFLLFLSFPQFSRKSATICETSADKTKNVSWLSWHEALPYYHTNVQPSLVLEMWQHRVAVGVASAPQNTASKDLRSFLFFWGSSPASAVS